MISHHSRLKIPGAHPRPAGLSQHGPFHPLLPRFPALCSRVSPLQCLPTNLTSELPPERFPQPETLLPTCFPSSLLYCIRDSVQRASPQRGVLCCVSTNDCHPCGWHYIFILPIYCQPLHCTVTSPRAGAWFYLPCFLQCLGQRSSLGRHSINVC